MKNKLSLKIQLIIVFILVIAGSIALITIYTSQSMLNTITKNNETVRLNSFNRVQSEISAFADDITKAMNMLLLHAPVSEFVKGGCTMEASDVILRQEIGQYLDRVISLNYEIDTILIRAWDGTMVGTKRGNSYNYNFSYTNETDVDYFFHGTDTKLNWSAKPLHVSKGRKGEKEYGVFLTRAFFWAGKEVQIAISMQNKAFYEIYAPFSESDLSEIYFCTKGGNIVSAKDPNRLYTNVAFADNFNAQSGYGSFLHKFPDGRESQIIYQTIGGPDWLVVEEIPILQYTKDIDRLQKSFLLIAIIVITLAIALVTFLIRRFTRPFYTLASAMDRMRLGEVGIQIEGRFYNEFGEIADCFNVMSTEIEVMMAENRRIEQQKVQYAVSALKSQINPHFMFNTINTIKWMAISQRAGNIADSLELLMALIKPLFKESTSEVQLSFELDYLENYIKLLNIRFGGIITFKKELPPSLCDHIVPRFILQPIVENSIQHGQFGKDGKGVITLKAWEEQGGLLISLRDNGCGIEPEALVKLQAKLCTDDEIIENGDSIGLANVHKRLKLTYGEKSELSVLSNDDGGLTVLIKLPKI